LRLTKKIASFLTERKCKIFVQGEFSTPGRIVTGVPHAFVLYPILYGLYLNDNTAAPGTHLGLSLNDICIYATEKHERRVL
jgi:hypothetical protein